MAVWVKTGVQLAVRDAVGVIELVEVGIGVGVLVAVRVGVAVACPTVSVAPLTGNPLNWTVEPVPAAPVRLKP